MARCRSPAPATSALRDAGAVIKTYGFRIYFAIIRVALADSFPRTPQNATSKSPLRFAIFGAATLCRSSQPWVTLGRLGSRWVYIGGRAGVRKKLPELPKNGRA